MAQSYIFNLVTKLLIFSISVRIGIRAPLLLSGVLLVKTW